MTHSETSSTAPWLHEAAFGAVAKTLSIVAVLVLLLVVGATACGSGERELSEEETRLLADQNYGETAYAAANVGAIMRIDNDYFRLGVAASDGEKAQLAVIHSTNRELNKTVEVELGSVFAVGEYRIEIVTVGKRNVVAEWAKLQ